MFSTNLDLDIVIEVVNISVVKVIKEMRIKGCCSFWVYFRWVNKVEVMRYFRFYISKKFLLAL